MRWIALLLAVLVVPEQAGAQEQRLDPGLRRGDGEVRVLKVCADPNNLPFSNRKQEGFENKLVDIVARDLGARVEYSWRAQRRGNVRETLNAGLCDIIPGVGSVEMLATTRPYYRSAYVAVTRADRHLAIDNFDDPRLERLRIGVQLIGDDGANTPPAHALMRRGITANVRGYMVYGDYRDPAPQEAIVKAVASGEVDIAFVWGPVAGWFAPKEKAALTVTPLARPFDGPQLPMAFDVSMGTRRADRPLREELDSVLARRSDEIRALLARYRVPPAP
jgi:quinoprotein dehydrogenase-associated probable ABC transporter substrate-binding protein